MLKLKNFFKNKVVRIIIVVLIVASVAIAGFFVINRKKMTNNAISDFTYVRTVTLGYSSLQETVVASGNIESQSTSSITSSTGNATISKINYSVGDTVIEGDVIIELDTSSLSKQISKASESVNKQKEALQENYDNASDNYDEINEETSAAKNTMNLAYADYQAALALVSPFETTYNDLLNKQNALVTYFLGQCDPLTGNAYSMEDIKTNGELKDENGKSYMDYEAEMKVAQENLNAIKSSTNYESLKKAYEEASSNYSKLNSSLSQAYSSLENAVDKLNEGVDSDTLDDLYDTVDDYKLKAKSSGQITSMNAVLGSSANGTLATIQDTSKLKISLTIDEYDILKIEVGMKCSIETDASDIVYEGEVTSVSHVASSSMGSSGFEVEVSVTSEDVSNLLIGMNAEVTIIISSGQENFTVPMDAVETREDGTSVIYVEDQSGEFYEVEVTVGDNNGYYVEIFGDSLKTGMKVRASADASEAEVNLSEEEMEENVFDMFSNMGGGSMPSGDMPSGGSMPSGGMPSGGGQGGFDGRQ